MGKTNDKQTFLMSKTWLVTMDKLPDEALNQLMRAVIAYQLGKEISISDPIISAIFEGYKEFFEDNEKKYKEQCERNAQIAKGRNASSPVVTSRDESLPVVTSRDESLPVVADTDTDTDIDTDNDNDFDSDKEFLTELKNTCSEQSTEPEVTPDCEALVLADGSEWYPTIERFSEYERLYPGVNVKQEFAKMHLWCLDNPKKRKTRNGVSRFVTSWLNRAQDGTSRASPYMDAIKDRVNIVDSWI